MTDFETYQDLHAKRAAVFRRLDEKAREIYAVFAVEKDNVSTAAFPWKRRTITSVKMGVDHVQITVEHFVTKFAQNGFCFLEYPSHKLKLPAKMLDLSGLDLLDAIDDFLEEEARVMVAKQQQQKKAA
jgi:hypothetical protein